MLNNNAKEWVKALRSGDYQQTTEVLHRDGGGYCCLGVACELAVKAGEPIVVGSRQGDKGVYVTYNDKGSVPPNVVMEWLGLKTPTGSFTFAIEGPFYAIGLVDLNDTLEWDFNEIADFIERDPDGLFF